MVTISSYPRLTRAIQDKLRRSRSLRKKYGSKVRRLSKKERLQFAKEMGWSYQPPVKFGTEQKVTMFETTGKQVVRENGKIVATLSTPKKIFEQRKSEAAFKRQKKAKMKVAQELIKRAWEQKTGVKYTGSPQQLIFMKKNIKRSGQAQVKKLLQKDFFVRSREILKKADIKIINKLKKAEKRKGKKLLDVEKKAIVLEAIALGVAKGAINIGQIGKSVFKSIKQPKKTAAAAKKFVKEADIKKLPKVLKTVAKDELNLLKRNPVSYAAELATFSAAFRLAGLPVKVIKKTFKVSTKLGKTSIKATGKYLNKLGKSVKYNVKLSLNKLGKGKIIIELKPIRKKRITKAQRINITKLEKQRIQLRLESKKIKKVKKGLQIKAPRAKPITRGGKTVYPFTNIKTNKITYFSSRKTWLRSVRRQEKFLSSKAGKKFLRQKEIKKKAPQVKKLEQERIKLRREQKEIKKLTKGLQIKASRIGTATKNGKAVYFFKDIITGKERFFKSRKLWLKAIKQQLKEEAKYTKTIKLYNIDDFFNNPFMIAKQTILKPTKKVNEFKKAFKSRKILGSSGFMDSGKDFKFFGDVSPKLKQKIKKQKKQELLLLTKTKTIVKTELKQVQKQQLKLKLLTKQQTKLKTKLKRVQKVKTKSGLRLVLKLRLKLEAVQKQKTRQKKAIKEAVLSAIAKAIKIDVKLAQVIKTKYKQILKVRQKTKTKAKTKTKEKTKQKLKTKLKTKLKKPKKKKTKLEDERKKKITEDYIKTAKKFKKGIYLSDLAANLLGEKAKGRKQRTRFLNPKTVFTGLERRLIV